MTDNLPNVLTISRIFAMALVVGLLFLDPPVGSWLALAAYVYACVTDFFDGYFARMLQKHSAVGRFLDPIADKLLVSAVLLMLVANDHIVGVSLLPAVIILCREILVSGLREFLAQLQVSVPVSQLAKWKTTLQMVALGFLIVGGAGPRFGPVDSTEIGIFGLWAAAALTLVTGYDYFRAGLHHMRETDRANG